MRIQTYVLLVALIALLGLCTVHEVMKQTRARYKIGQLLEKEEDLKQDLAKLKAELAHLKSANQLDGMCASMEKEIEPLAPVIDFEFTEPMALGWEEPE